MAKSGGKLGHNTLFKREIPVGSGTYVTAAEVKSISGPSLSRGVVDSTHLESPDDYEEQVAGLKNGGEISLALNFRPEHVSQGSSAGLLADFESGVERNWRIEWPQFPNTPALTVPGILIGWEPNVGSKDIMTVAVKIKVTGKPTTSNFA